MRMDTSVSWVYLLRSTRFPGKTYIGLTTDLEERLKDHAEGRSRYTSKFGPWELVVAIQFKDTAKAVAFELYLKSGSGHAFATPFLVAESYSGTETR